MTRGQVSRRHHIFGPALRLVPFLAVLILLAATCLPLVADTTSAAPVGNQDFGQYLADHQDDLAPFFAKYSGDFFRLAVPVLLGLTGWVVIFTMLLGWGIDVLMSRGYAFFCAPAFADLKRSIMYATGRLFLSFLYTCLMGLAVVVVLGFAHAGIIILATLLVLAVVAFAAQIVWILYLYRTDFGISIAFYIAVVIVHAIAAVLIAQPVMGTHASTAVTNFVDGAITPRLQVEAQATRHELAEITSGRNSAQAKVTECQNQIAQAGSEEERLTKEIEEKKNSDIYILAQIIKARAQGELESARDQLAAFPSKFPGSPLDALARTQLTEVNDQIAAAQAQRKQDEADAARAVAQARADLLARAARGAVTLSEMRQTLIGKTRAQVGDLLGPPSQTGTDTWGYRAQMILNPITNEHHGLTIYFNEGAVQSVDYLTGDE